ncbi:MAG: LLM class flavin-dependent oxidoreductase [Flavobacteriales bacterium]|jgi:luciferase family oxidoreductase group 1|nr:LLM class flavin-dependent oxidoreductase [Flavobacteriales bacterium]
MTPFSILDLAPVAQGSTPTEAFRNSVVLAQEAERLGYHRVWLAEHHGMRGIASAATSVMIAHIAGHTKTIRVGSGGVMLPNHAPYIIAEQFGTLNAMFPGRIDLGLGRAPGTDPATARALRRDLQASAENFPNDVQELQFWFREPEPGQSVVAFPGAGEHVPIWLLGSSLFSAQLAAHLGLPFAFASHFAPELMEQAIALYRTRFQPSAQLDKPYAMLTVNVFAADSDAEAKQLFTSMQVQFVNMLRDLRGLVQPPIDDIDAYWSPQEKAWVGEKLSRSFVGTGETVERGLRAFIQAHQPDELMISGHFFDPAARLRSLHITAEVRERLGAPVASVLQQ